MSDEAPKSPAKWGRLGGARPAGWSGASTRERTNTRHGGRQVSRSYALSKDARNIASEGLVECFVDALSRRKRGERVSESGQRNRQQEMGWRQRSRARGRDTQRCRARNFKCLSWSWEVGTWDARARTGQGGQNAKKGKKRAKRRRERAQGGEGTHKEARAHSKESAKTGGGQKRSNRNRRRQNGGREGELLTCPRSVTTCSWSGSMCACGLCGSSRPPRACCATGQDDEATRRHCAAPRTPAKQAQ